jgi:TolA-binding protein
MKQPACSRLWQVEATEDGRLGGSELASFRRHAATCRVCKVELERLRELRELSLELPQLETSPLEHRRQRQSLLRKANELTLEPPPRVSRRALGAAVVLAATTAMAAGGAYLLRPPAPPVPPAHTALHVPAPVAPRAVGRPARAAAAREPSAAPTQPVTSAAPPAVVARVPEPGAHPMQNSALHVRHAPSRHASALRHEAVARIPDAASVQLPRPPPAGKDFAGAMSAFNSGDFGRAEHLFADFVQHYPGDSRAEDAAFLRAVARQRRGDTEGAKALAREYLANYPGALRQEEAEAMLGR